MKCIQIGKVSFGENWSKLKWNVFKKEYEPLKKWAKLSVEEAAKKLGIKVPKKKDEGGD